MLIGFEAKRLFKNYTGLGNYSRFVVGALSDYYPAHDYLLYTPAFQFHPEVDSLLKKPNIRVVKPVGLAATFKGSIWRTWGIRKEQSVRDLSIFHGLSQELPVDLPKTVKKTVTIHDLIFLRYPQFYNKIDVRIYTAKVRYACKHADSIIAISKQTADDVVDFLNVDRSKIHVIYQGCHASFKQKRDDSEIGALKLKYGIPDRYMLNVGTIEERKNALLIVKSLLHIPEKERLPLVIVGRETEYARHLKRFISEHQLGKWVFFLHNASFSDFPGLYQGSEMFIYPSRFEGFGIPLVEAMESGVPVITTAAPSFVETAGQHALYVNPDNEEELALAITKIRDDRAFRDRMVSESFLYVERFQPPVVAAELWKLYHSMINASPALL